MALTIHIDTPADFNFETTVGSHGWLQLAPFAYDADAHSLARVHLLDNGKPVMLRIADGGDNRLNVSVEGVRSLSAASRAQITRDVSMMFSLDWDLSAFYKALRKYRTHGWVEQQRAGRMLVTPTVWEDLTKTLLTTNTMWSQTKAMVARVCALGTPFGPDKVAFPTPAQIAALPPEVLSEKIRAGYRADYLHALATRIASGEINPELWRSLPSDELFKAIKGLKGFGDYAAGTLLRLLGHFDRLAIDTECRAAYRRITGSETASDAEIRAYYEKFGKWRGLVMWMDIMRE